MHKKGERQTAIFLPFLAIFFPTTFLPFTKLRFRWSFWDAKHLNWLASYDANEKHRKTQKTRHRLDFLLQNLKRMEIFAFSVITLEPIKIWTCFTPQNVCLNLSFVKDINVVAKKMARNGQKIAICLSPFLSIRRYYCSSYQVLVWFSTNFHLHVALYKSQLDFDSDFVRKQISASQDPHCLLCWGQLWPKFHQIGKICGNLTLKRLIHFCFVLQKRGFLNLNSNNEFIRWFSQSRILNLQNF